MQPTCGVTSKTTPSLHSLGGILSRLCIWCVILLLPSTVRICSALLRMHGAYVSSPRCAVHFEGGTEWHAKKLTGAWTNAPQVGIPTSMSVKFRWRSGCQFIGKLKYSSSKVIPRFKHGYSPRNFNPPADVGSTFVELNACSPTHRNEGAATKSTFTLDVFGLNVSNALPPICSRLPNVPTISTAPSA